MWEWQKKVGVQPFVTKARWEKRVSGVRQVSEVTILGTGKLE